MTAPLPIAFAPEDPAAVTAAEGIVLVLVAGGGLTPAAAAADAAMGGALGRLTGGPDWTGKPGDLAKIPAPSGLAADLLLVGCAGETPDAAGLRKLGGAVAAALPSKGPARAMTGFLGGLGDPELAAEFAFGLALRAYAFDVYKTGEDARPPRPSVTLTAESPEAVGRASRARMAAVEGVFFARDLVNEPANVLGTLEFAARLAAMQDLGLEVEILEEDELAALGMRALLGVSQGSETPARVVVMRWNGGGDEAPLALVGKGVVFDTGGISLKPSAGMEEMTMDMGGAAIVAGAMRTVALRRAKANVIGVVGLVENMPDGKAQRPGDIVKSMKGDTIEVINTDAEGRLVLADVLWHVQEKYKPSAVIDFATLTGAMVVALGHETAGWFSNNDDFAGEWQAACDAAAEPAWRLPLAPAYDKLIKSRLADMKNIGGRAAGSITAAQFLLRFVKPETPWVHVDVAGVALVKEASDLAPGGATGWGVRALDALVKGREAGRAASG